MGPCFHHFIFHGLTLSHFECTPLVEKSPTGLHHKQLIILFRVEQIEVLERSFHLNARSVFSMLLDSTMMLSSFKN